MFITLTTVGGGHRPVYIIAEKVVSILPKDNGSTYVYCAYGILHQVKEHHDDVRMLVELTIKEGKENG